MNIKNILNKNYITYGILIIVTIILGFIFINNGNGIEETLVVKKGDLVQEVSISGKVISAESVDLAFSQTGRISGTYVDVGDVVSKGTVLASIENGDERAEILKKEAALQASEAALSELKRGSRPEEIDISKAKVFSAEANLTDEKRSLEEKVSDLYIKADDAVRTQADQLFSSPNSVNPQVIFETGGQLERDIIDSRVEIGKIITDWSSKILIKNDVEELAETSFVYSTKVKAFLEKIALALSTLETSSTISQTTIDGWKTDISAARIALSTATNNLVTTIGSVASSEASLSLAKKELLLEEAGVTNEDIEEQEAKVKVAEADVISAQAKYRKTIVVAPFTGIISKMDVKVGSSASSNTSLISMISMNTLQIESFVPEINSPLIGVGDPAVITLDAYGTDVLFGATIITTDPAETIRDGVSTYKAKLEFNEDDSRIKPGMTANIIVTTEEKKDVISIPQGIVFGEGSEKFVYVQEGEVFVKRSVTTGSVSSLGEVEILSGLSEGDIVSFNLPK